MSVNRRDFLRLVGVAAASAAPAAAAKAEPLNRVSDDWMGMLFDLTLCVGCRKCEWACRQENGPEEDRPISAYDDKSVFEQRRRPNSLSLTVVNRFESNNASEKPTYVKKQCMHCFEPACASACLVGAYRKSPEGPVVYDESVCIGCRYCMVACPFEVPAFTYDNPTSPAIRKCMMCYQRLGRGESKPACAAMCPVEAITFGKRSDLLELARRKIRENPERYVKHIYGENEVGGTCCMYIAGRPFEELGFNTHVGTRPAPELTKGFLSTVPFVQVLWPAMLMGAYAFSQRREQVAAAETKHANTDSTQAGQQP